MQKLRARNGRSSSRPVDLTLAVAASLTSIACGAAPEQHHGESCTTEQPILGGTAAHEQALNAIGALVLQDPHGRLDVVCTATLVRADVVLTAKHCTMYRNGAPLLDDGQVFFAVGPNATVPELLVEVVAAEAAEPNHGGVAELGSDMALLRLRHPLPHLSPLRFATSSLSEASIGTHLTTYGYGLTEEVCGRASIRKSQRQRGASVLKAIRGNVFDLIYGDRATYMRQAVRNRDVASAQRRYETGQLLELYEVWTEPGVDGSQTCFGDSGGPVMAIEHGEDVVVGVTSWSWSSDSRPCDYGAVVAVLGPDSRSLLSSLGVNSPQ